MMVVAIMLFELQDFQTSPESRDTLGGIITNALWQCIYIHDCIIVAETYCDIECGLCARVH